ncbi:helix-turn-helix domain-containing protein [Herbaspirillum sp. C7C2]|uniref:helix-turn-helix domain-containing protein n=1 Tax=Herbaspirillum sp. C7C2 TaxID=2736666 RepID=UPI001F526D85|nr:helix-turn-helix transcriptional regulator [Herbaspirillum sp. C7C2]MCI1014995.1 helix-turn-helix domain-containing protein [Herbaspirillum sp. C7C2]
MEISPFGERLKSERKRLGFSQEAFAAVGGVRKQAQISYEQGKTLPDIGFMAAVSKIGVDVSYVIFGVQAADALTADERQILEGYRHLDIIGKARVLGVIEGAAPADAARKNVTQVTAGGGIGQHITGDIYGTLQGPVMGNKIVKKK